MKIHSRECNKIKQLDLKNYPLYMLNYTKKLIEFVNGKLKQKLKLDKRYIYDSYVKWNRDSLGLYLFDGLF